MALDRAAAAGSKKVVKTVTVAGANVACPPVGTAYEGRAGAWGRLKLQLKVLKTEITTGAHTSVGTKIADVDWPIFPNHTPKTVYINAQALPLLEQETLELHLGQGTTVANVSGATATTVCWQASLQLALLRAERP
ncbi:MAG TPA: hypothetical protein VH063_03065 [Gaiellaceae bacterium]|nr:hypothetical protein [Gaiellaceae bacterium]